MSAEPLVHIVRLCLPWREEDRTTECGRPVSDVAGPVMDFDQFCIHARSLGQQRTAMTTCMTCYNTSQRWQGFPERQHRLSLILRRELGEGWGRSDERLARLQSELDAIQALVAAHRVEFEALLGTTTIDSLRRSRSERQRSKRAGRR